jgi:hypothetical protein
MNNRQTFFIALMFLATIVACVVPGLPTASTPLPAPTVDTESLDAMVAGTVSAVIAQTAQAQPTATFTIVAAATSTSTPTAEPTSTISVSTEQPTSTASVPTFTPTQSPTLDASTPGSTLTVQVDASTVFADERAGYQITAPAAWLIVRVNGQEYLDAKELGIATDASIQQSLLGIQNENPNILRLFAIDAQDGHIRNGFVTNMKFVWDEKNSIRLENDQELKASADQLAKSTPGLDVLSTKLLSTANKTSIGLIESKSTARNSSGVYVVVFQKQAIFNTAKGKMTVTLSTVEDLKGALFPVFDAMLETIKVSAK